MFHQSEPKEADEAPYVKLGLLADLLAAEIYYHSELLQLIRWLVLVALKLLVLEISISFHLCGDAAFPKLS